jgi:hypothetical protein
MIIVVMGAFKFHLFWLIGGGMFFAPLLPRTILILGGFLFCTDIFLTVFVLFADVWNLIIKGLCRLKLLQCKSHRQLLVRYICLALALIVSAVGVHNTLTVPEPHEVTMSFDRWPAELNGIRIAVLADLHADNITNQEKIRQIVNRTNETKPDLILIVGDFVDGKVSEQSEALLPLQDLQAKYGVYAVPGNHDYYSGFNEWMPYLKERGIQMLFNQHVMLFEGQIALGGVTDPAAYRRDMEGPDVAKAFKDTPKDCFRILMAHQPVLADDARENGVDLQLSGHTHGGMMWGLNQLVATMNRGLVSGMYDREPLTVYVSNGTCLWNGFPVRLGVPAELLLITAERRSSK